MPVRSTGGSKPPRKDWLVKAKGGKPRRPGALGLGRVSAHHQQFKQFINGQAWGRIDEASTRLSRLVWGRQAACFPPDPATDRPVHP